MAEFRMPSLGADMEAGILLEWLVHPGDSVRKGDIVAVVDTQKAAIEVECFATGVVEQLLVEPGTRVAVGTVLATIATGADAINADAIGAVTEKPPRPAMPAAPTPSAEPTPTLAMGPEQIQVAQPSPLASPVTSPLVRQLAQRRHIDLTSVQGTGVGGRITHADVERDATRPAPEPVGRVKASPLARRLAAELGVPLEAVRGTGPDTVIGAEDVRQAAAARISVPPVEPPRTVPPVPTVPAVAAAPTEPDRTQAMRSAIAVLMARSKREIPHYYETETVDVGAAMDWLREYNRTVAVTQRIVASALLLKAAARAAAQVPELNGFWLEDSFVAGEAVHLGVAISLRGGGLVAPAIHHADQRDLTELMPALRDLVARVRSGRLRRTEMSDPTITVSNLGDQGVDSLIGVIYPPQVALVGFGRVAERPWAVGGLLGVRPVVTVSLAADHRATDGVTGARYLRTVAQLLQRPEEL